MPSCCCLLGIGACLSPPPLSLYLSRGVVLCGIACAQLLLLLLLPLLLLPLLLLPLLLLPLLLLPLLLPLLSSHKAALILAAKK